MMNTNINLGAILQYEIANIDILNNLLVESRSAMVRSDRCTVLLSTGTQPAQSATARNAPRLIAAVRPAPPEIPPFPPFISLAKGPLLLLMFKKS